ncbi:MAG: hypothetical protein RIR00_948 [Pseudomonadota bacterium]|jgi:hypothetical protein
MNKLHAQLLRLFLLPDAAAWLATGPAGLTLPPPAAADALRLGVIGLPQAADWVQLAPLLNALQSGGLPLPALAIDGCSGLQLWFSLEQAASPAAVTAWLRGLAQRHLSGLPAGCYRVWPEGDTALPLLPMPLGPERWSAFIDPSLIGVFAETPWLEIEPNPERQAEVLAAVRSFSPADLARLHMAPTPAPPRVELPVGAETPAAHLPGGDPRQFLLAVMNDASLPLLARIEAAKALLHAPG